MEVYKRISIELYSDFDWTGDYGSCTCSDGVDFRIPQSLEGWEFGIAAYGD